MKSIFCALTLTFSSLQLFAQQDSIPSPEIDSLKVKGVPSTVLQYDSLKQQQTKIEVFQALNKTVNPNNDKFLLIDHPLASKFDSLWVQQQYESDYYELQKIIDQGHYSEVAKDLPTDTLKQRLAALNSRTPFNVEYNPGLERVINTFLTKKPDFLQRMLTMSQFYFPMFEQELDNHDIPLEMKYLSIVESALNPRARSRVGATGLWQFMYPTGKQFGLNVSSYVDERRDPIMATKAACKYLKGLYNTFNDWDLALAAYNSGPGNVSKAIRRSGGYKNYWNLRGFLPRETAGYVPAFLAMMYILEYADDHNLTPQKISTPYFETDTIHIKQLITFKQIAEVTNISEADLRFFNPVYKLDIIPHIKNKGYYLRLPRHVVGKFVANEEAIYTYVKEENEKREKPLPKLQELNNRIRYKVRNGEYLGKIANRYGVRISDLKRWNRLKGNSLKIGQRLTVSPRKPGFAIKKTTASKPTSPTNMTTYVVKEGD